MRKRKRKRRERKSSKLCFVVVIAITLLIGGAVVMATLTTQRNRFVVDCSSLMDGEVFEASFPPTPPETWQIDSSEATTWLEGYAEDPELTLPENALAHVDWVLRQMAVSTIPIARKTGTFIEEHRNKFEFKLGGFFPYYEHASGVLSLNVHPTENEFVVNVNYTRFVGSNRITGRQAFVAIVHELGGHFSDRLAEEENLLSQGWSEDEVFSYFRDLARFTPENRVRLACDEMRAYALQTALYEQMESIGLIEFESAQLRNELESLGWNWQSQRWYEFLYKERKIGFYFRN